MQIFQSEKRHPLVTPCPCAARGSDPRPGAVPPVLGSGEDGPKRSCRQGASLVKSTGPLAVSPGTTLPAYWSRRSPLCRSAWAAAQSVRRALWWRAKNLATLQSLRPSVSNAGGDATCVPWERTGVAREQGAAAGVLRPCAVQRRRTARSEEQQALAGTVTRRRDADLRARVLAVFADIHRQLGVQIARGNSSRRSWPHRWWWSPSGGWAPGLAGRLRHGGLVLPEQGLETRHVVWPQRDLHAGEPWSDLRDPRRGPPTI